MKKTINTDKRSDDAIFIFDYMMSKFQAFYKTSDVKYGTLDYFYIEEKFTVMARMIKEKFNGDFDNFTGAILNALASGKYDDKDLSA